MNPAELLVSGTAAVGIFGDVNITGNQTGMAPAAFTAAAMGGSPDAGLLQSIQQSLIGPAGNGLGFAPNDDSNVVDLAGCLSRIRGIGSGIAVFTGQLLADAAALQIQLCKFAVCEGIHGLGPQRKTE